MQTVKQIIQAVEVTFTQNEKGFWAYQFKDRQSKFKMYSLSQAKNRAQEAVEFYWMTQNKND